MHAKLACVLTLQIIKKEWKQGQKLLKKQSDVGMLLIGVQSIGNKLHVGMLPLTCSQSTETRCM